MSEQNDFTSSYEELKTKTLRYLEKIDLNLTAHLYKEEQIIIDDIFREFCKKPFLGNILRLAIEMYYQLQMEMGDWSQYLGDIDLHAIAIRYKEEHIAISSIIEEFKETSLLANVLKLVMEVEYQSQIKTGKWNRPKVVAETDIAYKYEDGLWYRKENCLNEVCSSCGKHATPRILGPCAYEACDTCKIAWDANWPFCENHYRYNLNQVADETSMAEVSKKYNDLKSIYNMSTLRDNIALDRTIRMKRARILNKRPFNHTAVEILTDYKFTDYIDENSNKRSDDGLYYYDDYDWNCPNCGGGGSLYFNDRDNYMVCNECRIYWLCGSNLFSGWRYMANSDFLETKEILRKYTCANDIHAQHINFNSMASDEK